MSRTGKQTQGSYQNAHSVPKVTDRCCLQLFLIRWVNGLTHYLSLCILISMTFTQVLFFILYQAVAKESQPKIATRQKCSTKLPPKKGKKKKFKKKKKA